MNILSLTGILPIPDIDPTNDYLVPLYQAYQKRYPEDDVRFIRTADLRTFWKIKQLNGGKTSYRLDEYEIETLPYVSAWRFVDIHSLISSFSSYYFNVRKLKRFLTENKIDLIQAEYLIPDGFLAHLIYRKFGIPYAITTHFEGRYFESELSKSIVVKVLRNARIVTPLNYASDQLYRSLGVKNSIVVPHGIDERFLNAAPQKHSGNTIKLLTVSSLMRYKNIDKVIMAVDRLKNKYNLSYTIIGSGQQEFNLKTLVKERNLENIVKFIPKVHYDQMPLEMSKYDVFILPSYFETFGRVLFEAMAVGLPTICAKNSGIHGYFREGIEGFSVVHDDIADISSKLDLLFGNEHLRIEMGNKARELMKNYSWDKLADIFHDIYKKCLNSA